MGPASHALEEFLSPTEDLVLRADRLDADQNLALYQLQGHALFIYGSYTLQADSLVWDARWRRLQAAGRVRLLAPEFSLEADRVRFNLAGPLLEADRARIVYAESLVLEADTAILTEQLWTATGVTVSLLNRPLRLSARQARFLPQAYRHNLLLEEVSWAGSSPAVPQLTFSIETGELPAKLPLETTLDTLLLPRLTFEEGQVKLESRIRLYDDPSLRLENSLDYRPDRGWQEGLIWQWRPAQDWLLQSNLTLLPQLRGEQQVTYNWGQYVTQVSLGLNESHRFERLFFLPLRLFPPEARFARAFFYSAPQPLGDWPLTTRFHLGFGYSSESQWLRAAALEATTHPLRWGDSFWLAAGKMGYLGLAGQHLFAAGGRLLWENQPQPSLRFGLYLDKWLASVPEGWLAKPDLLLGRLGHYWIFYPLESLGIGLLAEVSPHPFQVTTLDALISYRLEPLTGSLLLQALPLGIQARVDMGFF